MLEVVVPGEELFRPNEDGDGGVFEYTKDVVLQLEHSLISLSKWESKWKKPWFSQKPKTKEESEDYIKCMTLNKNVPNDVYSRIPPSIEEQIVEYINDTMTATTFKKDPNQRTSHEVVTAERIYYWMIAFNVPMECQKWHLNKLLTLLQVCGIESQPKKKMSAKDKAKMYYDLNEARRNQYGTKG